MEIEVSLPLDDGHLRRQCPFCLRQFKVFIPEDERESYAASALERQLVDVGAEPTSQDEGGEETALHCPYCGQQAGSGDWWTLEQVDYFTTLAHNVVAKMINRELIGPMRRTFSGAHGGGLSIEFKGHDIPSQETWIAPESDDMLTRVLPCCDLSIKIEHDWVEAVHCPECGFPHRPE
ncbi:hypothetical protein LLH23_03820 [bacterium]|nr:hypothetical protein [bacterium]